MPDQIWKRTRAASNKAKKEHQAKVKKSKITMSAWLAMPQENWSEARKKHITSELEVKDPTNEEPISV